MPTKPIPEGFHAITPYLFAQGASRLIEFIAAAFEGEVIFQQKRPDGAVMRAPAAERPSKTKRTIAVCHAGATATQPVLALATGLGAATDIGA